MKLIKGEDPGDLKLDVNGDPRVHSFFMGELPDMTEARIEIYRDEVISKDRHAVTKYRVQMKFHILNGGLESGVETVGHVSLDQINAILGILADAECEAVSMVQGRIW